MTGLGLAMGLQPGWPQTQQEPQARVRARRGHRYGHDAKSQAKLWMEELKLQIFSSVRLVIKKIFNCGSAGEERD